VARPAAGSPRQWTSAGVKRITSDGLRHSCASLTVSAGVNALALHRMLGQTSAKVTLDTYSDLFDDDLDAVATTLDYRYSPEVTAKLWPARRMAIHSSRAVTATAHRTPATLLGQFVSQNARFQHADGLSCTGIRNHL
jgi:hypothetical protein